MELRHGPGHASLYWVDAHTGIVQFTAPLRGERLGMGSSRDEWNEASMWRRCGKIMGKLGVEASQHGGLIWFDVEIG